MSKKHKPHILRTVLTFLFAVIFLLSGGMLIRDLVRSNREQAANEALIERIQPAGTPNPAAGTIPNTQQSARNYQPLLAENNHLAAWLTIPDTDIDYPVLFTPDNPEYYLRRAFDGSSALSGSLFIGADCVPDGSNIIIYGHNMKDGSMFGGLEQYADAAYAKEHGQIIYDLIEPDGSYERLTFEVIAAFYSEVYQIDATGVFRYYYATDLSDPEAFQNYITQVMAASSYDLGITADYGDRLLTLSTCSYHTEDGRFVVVAKQSNTSS